MSRLPNIETPQCERDTIASYIHERREIKLQVAERSAAKKLADRKLNGLRTRYAKERSLFTPGVDFICKLLEDMKAESALEFLRGFDLARDIVGLDAELEKRAAVQSDMFEDNQKEAASTQLAEAAA